MDPMLARKLNDFQKQAGNLQPAVASPSKVETTLKSAPRSSGSSSISSRTGSGTSPFLVSQIETALAQNQGVARFLRSQLVGASQSDLGLTA